MVRIRKPKITSLIFALIGFAFPIVSTAQTSPQGISLQGRIVDSSNNDLEDPLVLFTVQILSPGVEECVLYEESHTLSMTGSGGVFSLPVGTGSRSGVAFEDTSTLAQVFNNASPQINALTCASGNSYTPVANAKRKIKMTFDVGGGPQIVTQTLDIQAVPYALYADTLQGKAPADFLQTSAMTTQVKIDNLATTANYNELLALIAGTSANYTLANGGNFTPAADVDFNGKKIVDLAAPTSATDAVNKNYSDTKFGGATLDQTGLADGQSVRWNAGATKWEVYTPTTSQWVTSGSNIYYNTGNVGVGTTTPGDRLVVKSANNGGRTITIQNQSDTNPSIEMGSAGGSANQGYVAIYNNNSETIRLNSAGNSFFNTSGNVGIGTTTPGQKLTVNGTIESTGGILLNQGPASNDNMISLISSSAGPVNGSLGFIAAGKGSISESDGAYFLARGNTFSNIVGQRGNFYFSAGTPITPGQYEGSLNFWTNGTSRMMVDRSGNVGIGTTLPTSQFDVFSGGGGVITLSRSDSTAGSGNSIGKIQFWNDDTELTTQKIYGNIEMQAAQNITSDAAPGDMIFRTTGATVGGGPLERMRIDSSGSVGIGTATPTTGTRLDITGTGAAASSIIIPRDTVANRPTVGVNGMIRYASDTNKFEAYENGGWVNMIGGGSGATSVSAGNGTVGAPSISFSGDTDTGLYSNGADVIGISSGGANVFNISSTSISSPTTGGALITSGNGTAAAPTFSFSGDPDTGWFRPAADTMAASTGGTERVRINSSGNVGIGTSAPNSTLDISSSAVSGGLLTLSNPDTNILSGNSIGGIAFYSNDASAGGPGVGARMTAVAEDNGVSYGLNFQTRNASGVYSDVRIDYSGNLSIGNDGNLSYGYKFLNRSDLGLYKDSNAFDLYMSSLAGFRLNLDSNNNETGTSFSIGHNGNGMTGGTELFRVQDNGNVGIGTTAPASPLHVNSTASSTYFTISNSNAGATNSTLINFKKNASTNWQAGVDLNASGANEFFLYDNQSGRKPFQITQSGDVRIGGTDSYSGTQAMTILQTGNVGIGTTNPGKKLDVVGSSRFNNGQMTVSYDDGLNDPSAMVYFQNSDVTNGQGQGLTIWAGNGNLDYPLKVGKRDGTDILSVRGDGNVGIGTTSPLGQLDVVSPSNTRLLMNTDHLDLTANGDAGGWARAFRVTRGNNTNGQDGGAFGATGTGATPNYVYMAIPTTDGTGYDSAKILSLNNSGNVGVGTNSPTTGARLDVTGTGAAASSIIIPRDTVANRPTVGVNGMIRYATDTNKFEAYENGAWTNMIGGSGGATSVSAGNGTVGAPSISFSGDTNTGFYSNGADTIGIATNGANVFNISSSSLSSPTTGGALITSGAGTAAAPTFSFAGDPDTGWFRPAANTLAASTGGSERMRINASGQVGIGTNAPNVNLDVIGTGRFGDSAASLSSGADLQVLKSNAPYVTIDDNGDGVLSLGASSGGTSQIGVSSGDLEFKTGLTWNAHPSTTGSTRMTIKSTGEVGIGTTSPTSPLHILATYQGIKVQDNFTNNQQKNGNAIVGPRYINGNAAFSVLGHSDSNTSRDIYIGGGGWNQPDATALRFYTAPTYSETINTGVERMTILNSGNVGIGTTTPNVKLHVKGSGGGYVHGTIENTGANGAAINFINGNRSWEVGNATTGDFFIYDTTGSVDRFNITAATGNVGIGLTNPGYKLDVNGDVNIAAANVLRFGGTSVCTSAGCTAVSDVRLKENIQPLENSLEKILLLQGVEYDYRDKAKFGDKHQIGVIAQDTENIYPEVVVTDKKTGFKAVAYDHLVAPLIEAVKTLYNRIVGIEDNQAVQARQIANIEASKADKAETQALKIENAQLRENDKAKDQKIRELEQRLEKIEKALLNSK